MMERELPGSETAFLLTDVTRMWRQAFERAPEASDIGLTPSSVRALVYLARQDGVTQSHLASVMSIEPMTLAAIITVLVRDGLIQREINPADRRSKRIFTTPAGEDVLASLAPVAATAYGLAMKGMTPTQKSALTAIPRQMRANFSG